jgi:glutamine amidotransferase
MQLLGKESFELGHHEGLNLLPMSVKKLEAGSLKLPHIGWNNINIENQASLFNGIPADSDFYFVHSYHGVCEDQKIVAATCEYGQRFTAAVQKDNIFGTQFHPEKSQAYGFKVIRNFIEHTRGRK